MHCHHQPVKAITSITKSKTFRKLHAYFQALRAQSDPDFLYVLQHILFAALGPAAISDSKSCRS